MLTRIPYPTKPDWLLDATVNAFGFWVAQDEGSAFIKYAVRAGRNEHTIFISYETAMRTAISMRATAAQYERLGFQHAMPFSLQDDNGAVCTVTANSYELLVMAYLLRQGAHLASGEALRDNVTTEGYWCDEPAIDRMGTDEGHQSFVARLNQAKRWFCGKFGIPTGAAI